MNEVSQFTVIEQSMLQKSLSTTPNIIQFKSSQQQTISTTNNTINSHNSSNSRSPQTFKCQQCPQHLSNLTQIKKRQIKLQYEIEKLKEELQHLKRENQHLKQLQYNHHQKQLQKYNPIIYFKQDLQAQLYQAKYLLQLHTLSKSNQLTAIQNTKQLGGKQSQKQKQSLEKLYKPIDLKVKCQQLLLENIKLQQKLMIKDKIIQDRVLFPLYHYDQRILMLRKAVEYWYRKAQQESIKLSQVLIDLKKCQKQLKREVKTIIQQENIHWDNQLKKIISLLQIDQTTLKSINNTNSMIDAIKNNQNQIDQKQRPSSKSYNQNILIQEDHTIYSLCEKINTKEKNDKMTNRNSLKNQHILCQSCLNSSTDNENRKKSKNCSIINKKDYKSTNKTAKNSAKNDTKYDMASVQRKSEDFGKKTMRKKKNSNQANNNSSILGKNFENIEIKVKNKQKCQINCHKKIKNVNNKSPLNDFNCQRCAQRIL